MVPGLFHSWPQYAMHYYTIKHEDKTFIKAYKLEPTTYGTYYSLFIINQ